MRNFYDYIIISIKQFIEIYNLQIMTFKLLKETNICKIIIKVVFLLFLQRVDVQNLYCFIEKGKRFWRINNDFIFIILDTLSIIILN